MKALCSLSIAVAWFAAIPGAKAELRGPDRQQIKDALYATIYLRTFVPTDDQVDALIEISPTGIDTERLIKFAEAKRRRVYWPFMPNDTVKWGKPSYSGDTISVWFEGKRDELKVTFTHIQTLDDFKKAFDQLFSRVPLEDEHRDWPDEIRKAIAARQVAEGMSKAQAGSVVGIPLKTETTSDGEVWYPRQETGDTRKGQKTTTGLPPKVRFVSDKLVEIGR